jgi:hypothetical protein
LETDAVIDAQAASELFRLLLERAASACQPELKGDSVVQ